jgi:hypothetical protein
LPPKFSHRGSENAFPNFGALLVGSANHSADKGRFLRFSGEGWTPAFFTIESEVLEKAS